MNITKLGHAAFHVNIGSANVLVDPGNLSHPIADADDIDVVFISHEHPDHFDPTQLQRVIDRNPRVTMLAPESVVAAAEALEFDYAIQPVQSGEVVGIAGLALEFFGEWHEIIHSSLPRVPNLGVVIDGRLAYPGDSFALPPVENPETLVFPVVAPWSSLGQTIDYLSAVAPKNAIPVHDAIITAVGRSIYYRMSGGVVTAAGGTFYTPDDFEVVSV